jgi:zinc transporter ZupT
VENILNSIHHAARSLGADRAVSGHSVSRLEVQRVQVQLGIGLIVRGIIHSIIHGFLLFTSFYKQDRVLIQNVETTCIQK